MTGQEEDAHAVGFEHGQRIFRSGQGAEDLRVADVVNIRRMKRFLIDRGRCHGVRFPVHRQLNALLDVLVCRSAAHRTHHAEGEFLLVDISQINQIQHAFPVIPLLRFFHHIHLQISAADLHGILHDLTVADDNAVRCILQLSGRQGFHNNFRADTGRITDRHRNQRLFHVYLPSYSAPHSRRAEFTALIC